MKLPVPTVQCTDVDSSNYSFPCLNDLLEMEIQCTSTPLHLDSMTIACELLSTILVCMYAERRGGG